ncbi:phage tail protein, partial [Citrobacter freundii]
GARNGSGSVLKIGPYTFRNAFIQQLANGRWQVMRRVGQARYPIDVVKVPLETPLTVAFTSISKRLIASDMPKELSAALKNQLRIHLKR